MSEEKKDKPKISGSWKKARKLLVYLRPHRLEFGIGMLFLLGSSLASLAFPKYLGDLVDSASKDFIERIDEVALILIGILVLQAILSYFRIVIFVRVTEKMLAALRQATYKHLIQLPMSFFSERRVGELNSRISADVALLQETFTTTLAEFIRQLIIIVGGITLLAITSVKLTLFMLAILPAIMIIAVFFGRFIRKFSKDVQKQVAESNTIVEETLQGIQSVKAFANEFFEIQRYTEKTNEVARTAIKGGVYRGAFSSFIITGLFGAIVAVIWRGSVLVNAGEIQIGELFSFVIYSVFIGGSIGGLADVYARIQKAIGATEELMEILEHPTEELQDERGSLRLDGALSFQNVTFSYPSRSDMTVIDGMSFQAEPGQQIALVGASGAGKSTIVQLLYQFYTPQEGQISFDGKPAQDFELSALRGQMALVPQDVLLFGGTIRENIEYGRPGASEEEIRNAAKMANALEFIERFSEGFDTVVGERGVQLSGGQRQRIAIARAVLKDPCILVLDEATSSLDSESERLVQDALEKLMEGRTSLVIAHRLSTIRSADNILVLEQGKIVEQGKHEALMALPDSRYRELNELQGYFAESS
ncbi:ATP-binding cassette domain-containing protein [Cryomorphaceae bacterium]|nr:ATP-binding cassette domain-containing protein [Cryomorphaceae bacterium]